MADYRNTDYTIYKTHMGSDVDYIQESKLSYRNETMWKWINVKFIPKVRETFLEFKVNGVWEGIPWRVIQINPRLPKIMVLEMMKTNPTIDLVEDDDVREFYNYNDKKLLIKE